MKKRVILLTLFLSCILLINSQNILYANDTFAWRISSNFENAEIWKSKGENLGFKYNVVKHNQVSLGGNIIVAYNYLTGGDLENIQKFYPKNYPVKNENKKYYPLEFIKLIYRGYDSQGNIHLEIHKGETDEKSKRQLIKEINYIIEGVIAEEDRKIMTASSIIFTNYYGENMIEHYKIDPSKIIIFNNNLIPPLEVKTNKLNSKIKVEILN